MAGFVRFYPFLEALCEKKHDLGSDTLKVMLSNTAPALTNAVKADIVEIAPGNGYAAGGSVVTVTSSAQSAGVYKLVASDVAIVAAGGSIGPFRYVVLYNDTAPSDELIGYWDYGSAITLADTETFTLDLSAVNGVFQLS